jgi:ribonuclease HI
MTNVYAGATRNQPSQGEAISLSMPPDPRAVQISVDGSCLAHEGRKSGYAGYVLQPDEEVAVEIVFQGVEENTINRMELAAVIAALEWTTSNRHSLRAQRVQIFTDSQYVIDNIPRAGYWARQRWRNADGKPIKNWDLWKKFLTARYKTPIRTDFEKVSGKSTPLLRQVDKAAKTAARMAGKKDTGLIVGKLGRALTKGPTTIFPSAGGQELLIRPFGSKVASKDGENEIRFEVFDSSLNEYVGKHFAFATPEVGAQLHRQRGFRVQMNDNPKYPQIARVIGEEKLPKIAKEESADACKQSLG